MNLRVTIGLILTASFLATSITVILVFNRITLHHFERLERQDLRDDLERVSNALASEVSGLARQASDWATWDDTYEFIHDRNQKFIDSNVSFESLQGSGVDNLLFYNEHGALVKGYFIDRSAQAIREADTDVMAFIISHPHTIAHASEASQITGLVRINEKVIAYASLPILTSSGKGPVRGAILWSRTIDGAFQEQLSKQLKLDITFIPDSSPVSPLRSETNPFPFDVEISTDNTLRARLPIFDSTNRHILTVVLAHNREIFLGGIAARTQTLAALIASGAVISLLIFLLLEANVLRRLRILSRGIRNVKNLDNLDVRLRADGSDEIAALSNEFNHMLEIVQNAAHELTQARNEAERANEAKTAFVTNISHELRTPLNGIMGMISALKNVEADRVKTNFLDTAMSASRSLLALLNEILDHSKAASNKIELELISFDLHAAVREAVLSVSHRAHEKGLRAMLVVYPDVPRLVKGDPLRTKQILVNLLGNAIKFTLEGEVTVLLERVSVEERNTLIRLTVKDNGIGIPLDKQHLLFQPFSQVDSSTSRCYGGTGLGLSICQQLLQLMQGSIAVESEPGKGSSFICTIPFTLDESGGLGPTQPTFRETPVVVATSDVALRQLLELHVRYREAPTIVSASLEEWIARVNYSDLVDGSRVISSAEELFALQEEQPQNYQKLKSFIDHGKVLFSAVVDFADISAQHRLQEEGGVHTITLPLIPDDIVSIFTVRESQAAPQAMQAVSPAERPLKVLVVDDISFNRTVLQALLHQMGHECICVEDGRTAIQKLSNSFENPNSHSFDIVFMDLQMPFVDGFIATQIIRNKEQKFSSAGSRVPIVAVTAHDAEASEQKVIESGFDAICQKPIEPATIRAVIERLVNHLNAEDTQTASAESSPEEINIKKLSARFEDDEEIVRECLQAFMDEMPSLMNTLEQMLKAGQRTAIQDAAHAVKGALANAAAERALLIAVEIERSAHQASVEDLVALGTDLRRLVSGALQRSIELLALDKFAGQQHLDAV